MPGTPHARAPNPPAPQHRSSVDYSFIEHFCRTVVAAQYSTAEKRAVLAAFVEVFREGKLPEEQLERILQVSGRRRPAGAG